MDFTTKVSYVSDFLLIRGVDLIAAYLLYAWLHGLRTDGSV
jgi:hypothetical protein